MKKYALPLALFGAITLQACNQQGTPEPEAAVEAAPAELALTTSEQRLSYGIAYGLGKRMQVDAVPLDVDAFTAGLSDAMSDAEPRLTQEEIQAEMQAYQEKATAEQQAAQAAAGSANLAVSEAYLAENASKEGVVITDSGLQYEILEAGDGAMAGAEDTVEVHYSGTLVDGTQFDSSYDRGEPVQFGVGQVIPGWTEALMLMPVGSKWRLTIPSDLGYGAGGAGNGIIGPNAALVFEVELLSIPSQEEAAPAEAAAEG